MGKTTFAMNIVEHAAIQSGKPVAVFSMEMPGDALAMRMMSSLGRIDQTKVRTGRLDDDDWPRLTSAVSILSEAPLFIDDTPALSPTELRARARRLKREHNLGLIVIDEEPEWTYKQSDQSPRYHARDVALKLAGLSGATVILGSATPDVESYYRARKGDYHLLELPERVTPYDGSALPQVLPQVRF